MIPQFTPTQSFSAFWPRRASRTASHGYPDAAVKARAVAISKAADEDSPAPIGTSPASTPSQPRSRYPSPCMAQAIPLTYSDQPVPDLSWSRFMIPISSRSRE